MFTWQLATDYLLAPDSFWSVHHILVLWTLGLVLDFLLLCLVAYGLCFLSQFISRFHQSSNSVLAFTQNVLTKTDKIIVWCAAIFLLILVGVTFFSVIGRQFYKPIPDDITVSEFAMVGMICLMLGVMQGGGDHLEVRALADRLKPRFNVLLRFIGLLIGFLVTGMYLFTNLNEVPETFLEIAYGSLFEIPLWPARLLFLLGIAWWSFRIGLQIITMLWLFFLNKKNNGDNQFMIDRSPLLAADSGAEKHGIIELNVDKLVIKPDSGNPVRGKHGT